MPALLPLFNHSCLWTLHGIRVEKRYTTFRTNGSKVQDLWLVITCVFLSHRERERGEMSYDFNITGKRTQAGISFWYKLLRQAVSQCFHIFFTISEIPVVLLGVVSLIMWLVFFLYFFLIKTYCLFGVIVPLCKWLRLHSQLQVQGRKRARNNLFKNKKIFRKYGIKPQYLLLFHLYQYHFTCQMLLPVVSPSIKPGADSELR